METEAGLELDPQRFTTRSYGRRNWLREARHFIDEQRRRQARPIPRSRARRLQEAARRLEQDHAVEREANAQYEAWRARGIAADGDREVDYRRDARKVTVTGRKVTVWNLPRA